MAVQPVPGMTPVPTFPSLSERAAGTYNSSALAFGTHMHAVFNAELLAVANNVKYNADDSKASADTAALSVFAAAAKETAAASSAAAAAASANTAAAAAGGQLWVSGTTYAVGALVFSAATGRNYRRIVAGAGTTDPSADSANWRAVLLDVETGLPTIRPTLLLDFANSRSVDPRITFTRASTATRTNEKGRIETVAANVPRIDFAPVTGECRGLLIEEQRTNLLTYSEQFDNAAWVKTRSSVTPNAIAAPDGTLTADKLVEDTATNSNHYVASPAYTATNTNLVFSCCAKVGERNCVLIEISNFLNHSAAIYFNLQTGNFVNVTTGAVDYTNVSGGMQSLDNGWFRIFIAATKGSANNISIATITTASSIGVTNYTGDGTSGLYIWGAQLEVGSFPTSYIPTTTTQVTRAADVASMTGTNFSSWYRQDEGTLLFASKINRQATSPVGIASISDGSANNSSVIFYRGSGTVGVYALKAGVPQADLSPTPVMSPDEEVIVSYAYKENDFAASGNGASADVDTSGSVPQSVNVLSLGISALSGGILNGHIRRIASYPVKLSSSQLQALSAL